MPGIVEFPKIVQRAQAYFGDLFYGEPQRRHFAEYLTGLMVAQRKTVLGISDEFPEGADQSCLNRFLTAVDWDEYAVNQRRLELLQKDPSTRYSELSVAATSKASIAVPARPSRARLMAGLAGTGDVERAPGPAIEID